VAAGKNFQLELQHVLSLNISSLEYQNLKKYHESAGLRVALLRSKFEENSRKKTRLFKFSFELSESLAKMALQKDTDGNSRMFNNEKTVCSTTNILLTQTDRKVSN
jgi:hypothetical protein